MRAMAPVHHLAATCSRATALRAPTASYLPCRAAGRMEHHDDGSHAQMLTRLIPIMSCLSRRCTAHITLAAACWRSKLGIEEQAGVLSRIPTAQVRPSFWPKQMQATGVPPQGSHAGTHWILCQHVLLLAAAVQWS